MPNVFPKDIISHQRRLVYVLQAQKNIVPFEQRSVIGLVKYSIRMRLWKNNLSSMSM